MMNFLPTIAKALVGAVVTAGAAFAGAHGVPVPAEVQGWVSDTMLLMLAGLIGGGAIWVTPNTKPVKIRKNKK